ncbi:MAG TPA: hypothetical protein VF699_12775 [Caulobacteraceae bacterium]|jgi:hypothetical protein
MRFLVTSAAAVALLVCSSVQAQEGPDVSGKWANTSWGVVDLKVTDRKDEKGVVVGKDAAGTYTSSNGKVSGELQGSTLEGYWMQPHSSVACKTKQGGTAYWGRLRLTFDGDKFTGHWGYCDEVPDHRGVSGQRS